MNINVPHFARSHFWEEPPLGHQEFWSFRSRPACVPGEPINFLMDGDVVATACVERVEEPGLSECEGSGRFEDGYKVFWLPETFEDLRAARAAERASQNKCGCGGSGWKIVGRIREECPCRAWERKVAAMAKADKDRLDMVIWELMRSAT